MRQNKFISGGIFRFFLCFLLLGAFLIYQMLGASTKAEAFTGRKDPYLPEEVLSQELTPSETEALILTNSSDEDSPTVQTQMEQILSDMRVGYNVLTIDQFTGPWMLNQRLNEVKTAVVTFGTLEDINKVDPALMETLMAWVSAGGRIFFTQPFSIDEVFEAYAPQFGVESYSEKMIRTENLYFSPAFMGGGGTYTIEDPYNSADDLVLLDDAVLYAWVDNEGNTPLLWSYDLDQGRVVVANWGYAEKDWRGLYASAYSLLENAFAYPVINTSTIFLDDFPSPVPNGYDEKLKEDFNATISDYYTNIWLPDVLQLGRDYGIKFTGAMIETYEDDVSGSAEVNTNIGTYQLFGSVVLDDGGEIAIHGYNHQPLWLTSDTANAEGLHELGYVTWPSTESIVNDFAEMLRFTDELFPQQTATVYVPPSNIISEDGRKILHDYFPQIKTIASMYFEEDDEPGYTQEFGIGEDGIVNMPRITSDCKISDYMRLAIFSELNYHMANLHFIHPDDALDIDRGRDLGWNTMREEFIKYLDQVYNSMPLIRNRTASEAAGAVQRYSHLTVQRTLSGNSLTLKLDGFYDEAYLMVRLNDDGTPTVTGGELEHVTGNLYLLHATSADIVITWEE